MTWNPITEPPDGPMRVILFYPGQYDPTWNGCDYGTQMGYYGGPNDWRQQGTNHDCFEKWAIDEGVVPTHWAPVPIPPMT